MLKSARHSLFHAVVFYATGNACSNTAELLTARREIVSASPLPFSQAIQCAREACNRSYAAVSFCVEPIHA